MFEVQTTVERAMREWSAGHDFLELDSPKLRGMPNQSGRELFTVEYFGRSAFLAQSPQFYKQMAMSAGVEVTTGAELGDVREVTYLHRGRDRLTP